MISFSLDATSDNLSQKMPKERKQRGRRKKKTENEAGNEVPDVEVAAVDFHQSDQSQVQYEDPDNELSANFFGLLDESEQTYFKTIDDAMVADEFGDTEERDIFVENVYKEAEGKELKLATSPLGSKVLEQLMARSKPEQIRRLFKTYQGNFHTLVRQRYASHVCEMLFAISATLVSSEMAKATVSADDESDEPYVSTENLFLYMFNEISPDLANLGADIYASHVIRDTLLILQGTLFTFEEAKGQSKRYHGQKKYSWARPDRNLPVPTSFRDALQTTIQALSSLPAAQLRMTASQPYSVSFVQVLIAIEAQIASSTDRPILYSLLGGETLSERDDYMESIMREPSGSKLFETMIDAVPADRFGDLYETYFKDRTAKFAHNPITNFVLQKVITTCLDGDIILAITNELSPIFRDLIELNHMQIIQRLIEANIRTKCLSQDLFQHIQAAFGCDDASTRNALVAKILETPVPVSIENADRPPRRTEAATGKTFNMQGVFLIKALLHLSDECFDTIASSLIESPADDLLSYAKSHAAVKVLEAFFENPKTTIVHRKRILNSFFGHFVDLSCDATASHFVDLCWSATAQVKLYKDRIAQELLDKADDVRGNYYGRIVWRNWNMDLFKNKRGEWNYIVKQSLAKENAMARLAQSKPQVTSEASQKTAPVMGMDPQRASMILDEGTKRAKKKLKRKEMAVDEVDDIFKKRRV